MLTFFACSVDFIWISQWLPNHVAEVFWDSCMFFFVDVYKVSVFDRFWWGYGSSINTIFRGMNIHLPAILMFTRGTRFWHTAMESSWILCILINRHGMISGTGTGEWSCGPAWHGPLSHAAPAGADTTLGWPRQQPRGSTPGSFDDPVVNGIPSGKHTKNYGKIHHF